MVMEQKDHSGASDAEECYELDLDDHSETEVDSLFEDAVAAVERGRDKSQSEDMSTTEEIEIDEILPAEDTSAETEDASSDGEVKALKERLLRTMADFDNYRKRSDREKASMRKFAVSDVLKDSLSVIDNLERALSSTGSVEELKTGLELVLRQHGEILKRHGVVRVEAVGQPFDPQIHEAVAREESEDIDAPMVTAELQSGYLLHDRLLRPAMVHVAMPVNRPAAVEDAEDADD